MPRYKDIAADRQIRIVCKTLAEQIGQEPGNLLPEEDLPKFFMLKKDTRQQFIILTHKRVHQFSYGLDLIRAQHLRDNEVAVIKESLYAGSVTSIYTTAVVFPHNSPPTVISSDQFPEMRSPKCLNKP